jgi:hypothetical protein
MRNRKNTASHPVLACDPLAQRQNTSDKFNIGRVADSCALSCYECILGVVRSAELILCSIHCLRRVPRGNICGQQRPLGKGQNKALESQDSARAESILEGNFACQQAKKKERHNITTKHRPLPPPRTPSSKYMMLFILFLLCSPALFFWSCLLSQPLC